MLLFGLLSVPYGFSYGNPRVKGKTEAHVERASAWVRDSLECGGLVVHKGKLVWLPVRHLVVAIRYRPWKQG